MMTQRKRDQLAAVQAVLVAVWFGALMQFSGAPWASAVMAGTLLLCAIGRWHGRPWTTHVGVSGFCLGFGVALLEWDALGDIPPFVIFFVLAMVLAFLGRWMGVVGPRLWLPVRLPGAPLDDADFHDSELSSYSAFSNTTRGTWLRWLGPGSGSAALYAASAICAALTIYLLFRDMPAAQAEWWAALAASPQVILAVALWTHGSWIRWYGSLLCVAWLFYVIAAWCLTGFNTVFLIFVPFLVTQTWRFWNWRWMS